MLIQNEKNYLVDTNPNYITIPIFIFPNILKYEEIQNTTYIGDVTSFINISAIKYQIIDLNYKNLFPERYFFHETNKNNLITNINNVIIPSVDTSDNIRLYLINKNDNIVLKRIITDYTTDVTVDFTELFKQYYISINPDYKYIKIYTISNDNSSMIGVYSKKFIDYYSEEINDEMYTYCKYVKKENLSFIPSFISSKNPFIVGPYLPSFIEIDNSNIIQDSSSNQNNIPVNIKQYNEKSHIIINYMPNYHNKIYPSIVDNSTVISELYFNNKPIKKIGESSIGTKSISAKVLFPNKYKTQNIYQFKFDIIVKNLPNFNYTIELSIPFQLKDYIKLRVFDLEDSSNYNYFFFNNDNRIFIHIPYIQNKSYRKIRISINDPNSYDRNKNIFIWFDDFTSIDTNKYNTQNLIITNIGLLFNRSGSDAFLNSKIPFDGTHILMEVMYQSENTNPYRNRIYLTNSIGGGSTLGFDYLIGDNNQIFFNGQSGKYIDTNKYIIRFYNSNGMTFEIKRGSNIIYKNTSSAYRGLTQYLSIRGTEDNRSKFYITYLFIRKYIKPEPSIEILDSISFYDITSIEDIDLLPYHYFNYIKKIYLYPRYENNHYKYYRDITIHNIGNDNLNQFQIDIRLDNIQNLIRNQKIRPDLKDFLLIDMDNSNILPIYIDNFNNSVIHIQTKINLNSNQNKILRLYYGNFFAENNIFRGNDVFDFFDDFTSVYIDPNIQNVVNSTGFSIDNNYLIGTDTAGYITSYQRFNPSFIIETKFNRINKCTNGTTILSLANSTTDCFGYLLHGSNTDYYRNNSTQVQLSSTIPINTKTICRFVVKSNTVDLIVFNPLNNTIYHQYLNISNSISNEYIMIGRRNDLNNSGEKYSVYQDYIRIRKYTDNTVNVIVGNEISIINIDTTDIFPNFIPIDTNIPFNPNSDIIPVFIHNSIESLPIYIDQPVNTRLGKIIPIFIRNISNMPVILSDQTSRNISDIKYIFNTSNIINQSNGYLEIDPNENIILNKTAIRLNNIIQKETIPFIIFTNDTTNMNLKLIKFNFKEMISFSYNELINNKFIIFNNYIYDPYAIILYTNDYYNGKILYGETI